MAMGKKLIDLTGQKFGKLYVLSLNIDNYQNGLKKIWNCKCDCGNFITVSGDYLRAKNITQSCGCNKFIDSLIGSVFGDLTVVSEYHNDRNKIRYICECMCGNIIDVDRYALINNKKTNCGCKQNRERPNRIKSLIGQRFGRLVVIEQDVEKYYTSGGKRIYKWICQCDCGNIVSVEREKLKSGHTQSCGCLLAEKQNITIDEYRDRYQNTKYNDGKFKDLTGVRFGKLVVLHRDENSKNTTKWVCQCDCGNIVSVSRNNLLSGHTNSCGCIDSVGESYIGMYLSQNNIKYKKEYTFKNCKDIHVLPFDFGILNSSKQLVGLIEYDGVQHFEPVRFNGMTQEDATASFLSCVKHDNIKNMYCVENNIPLLRIKYTQINNIVEIMDNFLMSLKITKSVVE